MSDYRLVAPGRIRINGKPTRVWYVVWSEGARSRRRSTGARSKADAERVLAELKALDAEPPEAFTVEDLCAAYLEARKSDPACRHPDSIKWALRPIRDHFGSLTPSLITQAFVRGYILKRRGQSFRGRKVGTATIDKELRQLRAALNWAVAENWMERAPVIKAPGGGAARERVLSRPEFTALLTECQAPHLKSFLLLAVYTGARKSAILSLTWDRVDFEHDLVDYGRSAGAANKRRVILPMHPALREHLLEAARARTCAHVVEWRGKPVREVRTGLQRAARSAGIDHIVPHDLRRTFATWALREGASFAEVAAAIGDDESIVRKHYAHLQPDYLKAMVGRL